ncbi:GNAT family N-acetyltransferase [Listeria booriae]|uniref:GNAT family N-acetyltransferase n=1 Tax=Listeria booriae TaxID=1552123 RepID=UPI0016232C74|nr:GNAT family N-acetyltransferase [Listeria booriae]MBC1558757.1 GNAT family N-acetyltransferase [Listeria booriae]
MKFPTLYTERLTLRETTNDDCDSIFALRSNESVAAFQERPLQGNMEEALAFIEKINAGVANNDWIFWALTLKETDELIGTVCLWNYSENLTRADLGYELMPHSQGQGYMQEALESVLTYGFNQLPLNRIDAVTHKDNIASINLLKNFNFTLNPDFKDTSEIMYTRKREVRS